MEIRILKFLAAIVGHCHEWKRGQVVELPSPSIEGRTDIVVIMFPRAEVQTDDGVELFHPAGMIVRNKGKYSVSKSRKIAKSMAALLDECEDYVPGCVTAYDDSERMIGDVDPKAYWVDLVEHPTALIKLQRAEAKPTSKLIRPRKKKAA